MEIKQCSVVSIGIKHAFSLYISCAFLLFVPLRLLFFFFLLRHNYLPLSPSASVPQATFSSQISKMKKVFCLSKKKIRLSFNIKGSNVSFLRLFFWCYSIAFDVFFFTQNKAQHTRRVLSFTLNEAHKANCLWKFKRIGGEFTTGAKMNGTMVEHWLHKKQESKLFNNYRFKLNLPFLFLLLRTGGTKAMEKVD